MWAEWALEKTFTVPAQGSWGAFAFSLFLLNLVQSPSKPKPLGSLLKKKVKSYTRKPSVWVCSCGCIIPKKGANLSGGPHYKQDYPVHCPDCGRIVAQFVNPKETQ